MFIFLKGSRLWLEGIMRVIKDYVFDYNDHCRPNTRHTGKPKTQTIGYVAHSDGIFYNILCTSHSHCNYFWKIEKVIHVSKSF